MDAWGPRADYSGCRSCNTRELVLGSSSHPQFLDTWSEGLVFVVALSCVLGCGGQDDVATTWSAEAKSPDGRWLATARSQQWGGPGTAYDATTVSLKKVHSSDLPKQVLLFSHQFGTMNLDMKWLTATHLDVTYGPSARAGDHVNLDSKIARFD